MFCYFIIKEFYIIKMIVYLDKGWYCVWNISIYIIICLKYILNDEVMLFLIFLILKKLYGLFVYMYLV